MKEITIQFCCENKQRVNDDHDFVNARPKYHRGDAANTYLSKLRQSRCSFCRGQMVEKDVNELRRKHVRGK